MKFIKYMDWQMTILKTINNEPQRTTPSWSQVAPQTSHSFIPLFNTTHWNTTV